ncbi:DNA translocase FtsK [Psychrobacter sp. GP33]|uniref:DNA translocase FtsK n=1 Tax=Psychrobacter sp. GP33 TaxID=2758709 RepID=UPI0015FA2029|nr:DNA translocase FtsK 4TM domain-containing protein [Psychrobacter sp. GP33]
MISAPLIEYLKKGVFTILGLMLAVYLFVILLTYTSNDPSWSHISSDMTTVNNTGGAMGAWLSDLLYSFFGFGAWWLLAFLIYESILIWWDNKPAFWVLRLVAYVFLLLSASALIAQFMTVLQPSAETVSTGIKGLTGGVIGTELQVRLAQLLTAWGSLLFLTLFVVITATFAFNIHWTIFYQKLTTLSWLGSGIKNDAQDVLSTGAKSSRQPSAKSRRSRVQDGKDLIISKITQKRPDYGQLPLELQPDANGSSQGSLLHDSNNGQSADSQARFSGVLTDFLTQSGLGESVKASVQQASDRAKAAINQESAEALKPSYNSNRAANNQNAHNADNYTVNAGVKTNPNTSHNTVSSTSVARKVEPSFAWNDASTVEDLLAQEAVVAHGHSHPLPASSDEEKLAQSITDKPATTEPRATEPKATAPINSTVVAPKPSNDLSAAIETPVVESRTEFTNTTTDNTKPPSKNVDGLAATGLTEHESVSAPTTLETSFTADTPRSRVKAAEPTAPVVNERLTHEPADTEADTPDVFAAMVSQTSIPQDMTPTNTPPANPKATLTATDALVNDALINENKDNSLVTSKPSISFAVPEGNSSNHITDMMPDETDDELDAPVMPEIHDDTAFSQRSRSMQTAAYRAQLTPIPALSILDKPDPNHQPSYTTVELEQLSELLEIKLQEFNVKANVVNAIPGPVVTRFEVELAPGVKASKVTGISRDLARSLSMASLRVVEVIPGKPYIGIEVPNKQREMVRLIELLDTEKFKDTKSQISIAMGKDIGGKPIISDLARAPHMLVAGTTGSGKSVLVNSMLLSMLLKYTPEQLRLILIDPKQLELANYNDIPHLLTPVVTDMTEAASSLSWCVAEMERRYFLMSVLKVRKLSDFNRKVRAAEKSGNPILDPLWKPNDSVSISQAPKMKTLPMIVIVADEFADMIMQVGKQAEELITRLAQKSRAAGIHLILATQRPSVDVITGLIKANIPVRAALRVNSKVDSRTILDSGGAEDMLGNGDMLFLGPGQIEPDRVHGAYVSDEEVNSVCDAWRERGAPDYIDNMAGNFELSSIGSGSTGSPSGEDDDLYNEAVGFIMETRKVSASSIQRKFSIGYNRAARIVDSMEEAGIVSPMGKSGKRELLM